MHTSDEYTKRILTRVYRKSKQSLNLFQEWGWRSILNSNPNFHQFIIQLNLSRLSLNDDELAYIFDKKWVRLQILWLTGNKITNECIKIILNGNIPQLSHLMLNDTKINQLAIHHMLQYDLHKMVRLKLNNNKIGWTGVKYLIKIDMPNLRELQLQQCGIGNEGMKNLSKCYWPQLTQIYLQSNMISFEGFTHLPTNQWPDLQYIQIDFNKLYGVNLVGLMSMQAHVSPNRPKINVQWRIQQQIGIDAELNQRFLSTLTRIFTHRFENRFW